MYTAVCKMWKHIHREQLHHLEKQRIQHFYATFFYYGEFFMGRQMSAAFKSTLFRSDILFNILCLFPYSPNQLAHLIIPPSPCSETLCSNESFSLNLLKSSLTINYLDPSRSSSEELQSLEDSWGCLTSLGFIPTVGEMLTARSFLFFLGKNLMLRGTKQFQFLLKLEEI